MGYSRLPLSQIIQAFNMRSERSLFKIGFFTNKKLNGACLISILLILLVLFTPLSTPFGIRTLPVWLYFCGFGLAAVPFFVMEFSKAFGLINHHH